MVIGALDEPFLSICTAVDVRYVPPRMAIVPPAATRSTACWSVATGWANVPGLASLPFVATTTLPGGRVVGGGEVVVEVVVVVVMVVVGGGVVSVTTTSSNDAVALKVATPAWPDAYWVSVAVSG